MGCQAQSSPLSPLAFPLIADGGWDAGVGDAGFVQDAGDAAPPRNVCTASLDAATTCTPSGFALEGLSAYDTTSGYFALASADLDGDGLLDLVAGNYTNGSGTLAVYFGQGNGGLSGPTFYPGDGRSIAIGDLNDDGLPDIVATEMSSAVNILLNQGDGGFALVASYVLDGGYLGGLVAVAIGDLNGDCWPDLVVETNSSRQFVLLNQGNGTFDQVQTLGLFGGFGRLVVADLNGDGRDDIALASISDSGSASLAVILSLADGSFETTTYVLSPQISVGTVSLLPQQSAFPDLAVSGTDGMVLTFHNSGDGHFTSGNPLSGPNLAGEWTTSGDFNGDCIPDFAIAGFDTCDDLEGAMAVFYGDGDGGFGPAVILDAGISTPAGLAPLGEVASPRALAIAGACGQGFAVLGDPRRH